MSILRPNELQAVTGALTSFVLAFESTSDEKRKQQMQNRMSGCYDQAKHNAKKAAQQAQQAEKVANSFQHELYKLEAAKWQSIADAVLHVMHLVQNG